MSFFDTIKQTLHIGGAKLILTPSQTVVANGSSINMKLTVLGGQVDQAIGAITISLLQKDTWLEHQLGGQRANRQQTFTLATKAETTPFTISAGSQGEFNFSLPVQAVIVESAPSAEMDRTLGKIGSISEGRIHTWWVEAKLAIQGGLDATARCDLTVRLDI